MFRKFALLVLLTAFSFIGAKAGGVTNIKSVYNTSSKTVLVSAFDNKTLIENSHKNWVKTSEVTGRGCSWYGDMWIPWANNAREFASHNIRVEIYGPGQPGLRRADFFAIYQTGEEIRSIAIPQDGRFPGMHWGADYARNYYGLATQRVEGLWRSGGDRNIRFYDRPNGSVGFAFEEYRPPPRNLTVSGCP